MFEKSIGHEWNHTNFTQKFSSYCRSLRGCKVKTISRGGSTCGFCRVIIDEKFHAFIFNLVYAHFQRFEWRFSVCFIMRVFIIAFCLLMHILLSLIKSVISVIPKAFVFLIHAFIFAVFVNRVNLMLRILAKLELTRT